MAVCLMSGNPPTGGPIDEPLLEQVWLNDVFDRVFFFTDGCRQGVEADRSATEFVYNGFQ